MICVDWVEEMRNAVEVEVRVTLTGAMTRRRVSVDDYTIPLGPHGSGRARVLVLPPEVVVRVQVVSPDPASFRLAVEINGRRAEVESQAAPGKVTRTYAFPLADFGL